MQKHSLQADTGQGIALPPHRVSYSDQEERRCGVHASMINPKHYTPDYNTFKYNNLEYNFCVKEDFS